MAFLSITHRYLKPLRWWFGLCYLLPVVIGLLMYVQSVLFMYTNTNVQPLAAAGASFNKVPDIYWLVSLCLLVTMLEGFRIGPKLIAWSVYGLVMLVCFMRFDAHLAATISQVVNLDITSTKEYAQLSSLSKIIGYLPTNLRYPSEELPGVILTCDVPVKWSIHIPIAAKHIVHLINTAWLVLLYAFIRWVVLRPGRRQTRPDAIGR